MTEEREHSLDVEPKKRYAEDILRTLPAIEIGRDIPRITVTKLVDGRDTRKKLSTSDLLDQQGWDSEAVLNAKKGDVLMNTTGEIFEVVSVNKGQVAIKNVETDHEGVIVCSARKIKVQKYVYHVADSAGKIRKISVFDMAYRDHSLDTTDLLDGLIKSLPTQCVNIFDEIQIHKELSSGGGKLRIEPSLLSDKKIIVLYVDPDIYNLEDVRKTFYHELGHAIVKHFRGIVHPGKKWQQAMQADRNSVSEYAANKRYPKQNDNGEIEDIADSIMLYLAADGAKNADTFELKNFCSNRFRILDSIFDELSQQQMGGIIDAIRRKISKTSSVFDKAAH